MPTARRFPRASRPGRLRKAADRRGLRQEVGRGRRPPLGRLAGLPQRHHRQRGAHQQSGRDLPRPPQRPALPALQPLRLRPGQTRRARRPADRPGPLDSGRVCPAGAGSPRRLRPVTSSTSSTRRSASSSPSNSPPSTTTWSKTGFTPIRRTPPAAARPRPRCTGWSSASARCWRRSWPSPPTRPGSSCPARRLTQCTCSPGSRSGFERPEAERAAWKALFELRELALPELEKARQAKADRQGAGGEADLRRFKSRPDGSPGASGIAAGAVECLPAGNPSPEARRGSPLSVTKAAGQKCERCWHWETDVGSHPEHPTICARCVRAVQESASA